MQPFGATANELGHAESFRIRAFDRYGKLLSPDARNEAAGGLVLLEQRRDPLDHLVSCWMPVSVVDALEVIDVDHEDSATITDALTLIEQDLPFLKETAAPTETRQVVEIGSALEFPE